MKAKIGFSRQWMVVFFILAAWASTVSATPPSTPITLELELSSLPQLNTWTEITVKVQSTKDAPDTYVELVLSDGVNAEETNWMVDLEADTPVTISTRVIVQEPGNSTISARAIKPLDGEEVWGDMKSIPLSTASAPVGKSEMRWKVDKAPVAEPQNPANPHIVSMEATPFAFPPPSAPEEEKPEPEPVIAAPPGSPAPLPSGPIPLATVTLSGRWKYLDRSGVARDIDQQLLEIRHGDGSSLNPAVFCFTNGDGTFSCNFTHPGTTMRIYVRSWMSFSTGSGSERLGVFSGPEVSGGCGSDDWTCSYPVQTGEINCSAGSSCDTGTWTVQNGEPWLGAMQMTQDLIRSWKKLYFDTRVPANTSGGPCAIDYPVPYGHGTHGHSYDDDPLRGWISIEPPNQQSGDCTNHEYGHIVMSNLWIGYYPTWPIKDCPNPHYISNVSGPGCALSEGFASFWAWYSNASYDGDNQTSNDGPVYNWAGGASTNFETRAEGTFQAGDWVEGNVTAAFGDIFDSQNEGPASGPGDRITNGVQCIWHTTFFQSYDDFSDWWYGYWATLGHDPCPVLNVLQHNTINYTLGQCNASSPAVTSFAIKNGAASTIKRGVRLNNTCSGNPTHYMASQDPGFSGASWQSYATNPLYNLTGANGTKTVYFKVKNGVGTSGVASDTIKLTLPVALTVNNPQVSGNISPAGDLDWYKFTAASSGVYTINTWAGTLTDNYMYLYGPNSSTALLEQDDDDGTGYMAKIVRSLSPGTYYVKIKAYSASGTGTYTIRVTR